MLEKFYPNEYLDSAYQIEIMMELSLRHMGPSPPSLARVKEEPPSRQL